jgi:hypothetical protein
MPTFIELVKQARDQVIKRKEKKYSAFVANIEDDPDLQEFLQELTALRNARKPNGRTPRPVREPIKHKYSAGLEAAIISVRPQLPKRFGADDVLKILEGQSFTFNAKDHRQASKDALYRLKRAGRLKQVGKGLYEFVD